MGLFVEEEVESFRLRNARHVAPIRRVPKRDPIATMPTEKRNGGGTGEEKIKSHSLDAAAAMALRGEWHHGSVLEELKRKRNKLSSLIISGQAGSEHLCTQTAFTSLCFSACFLFLSFTKVGRVSNLRSRQLFKFYTLEI